MSYPTHCPTCRHPLAGLKRRYCGWGLATIDRCHTCGVWVMDPDGLDLVEHDAVPIATHPVKAPECQQSHTPALRVSTASRVRI